MLEAGWEGGGRPLGDTLSSPLLLSSPSHLQSSHTSSSPPPHTTDNISEKSDNINYISRRISPTPAPSDSELSISLWDHFILQEDKHITVIVGAGSKHSQTNNIQHV